MPMRDADLRARALPHRQSAYGPPSPKTTPLPRSSRTLRPSPLAGPRLPVAQAWPEPSKWGAGGTGVSVPGDWYLVAQRNRRGSHQQPCRVWSSRRRSIRALSGPRGHRLACGVCHVRVGSCPLPRNGCAFRCAAPAGEGDGWFVSAKLPKQRGAVGRPAANPARARAEAGRRARSRLRIPTPPPRGSGPLRSRRRQRGATSPPPARHGPRADRPRGVFGLGPAPKAFDGAVAVDWLGL